MAGLERMKGLNLGMGALAVSALTLLTACDNGPSAVGKGKTATETAAAPAPAGASSTGAGVDHRNDPVSKASDGKAQWAASKARSAEEGAQRAFDRNGADFGAANLDQYVLKAHAFVSHPPKGTLTLTRLNGDTLFYDPRDNVFAVAAKDGAPRAMFKPTDGMAYWQKQKDQDRRDQQASNGRRRGNNDES